MSAAAETWSLLDCVLVSCDLRVVCNFIKVSQGVPRLFVEGEIGGKGGGSNTVPWVCLPLWKTLAKKASSSGYRRFGMLQTAAAESWSRR